MTSKIAGTIRIDGNENEQALGLKSKLDDRATRVALGYIENQVNNARKGTFKKPLNHVKIEPTSITSNDSTKNFCKPQGVPLKASKAVHKSLKSQDVQKITKTQRVTGESIINIEKNDQSGVVGDVNTKTDVPGRTTVAIVRKIEDIDAEDGDSPQLVSEYVNDIYLYMMHLERVYRIEANFLRHDGQDVTPKMRSVLVDWLCMVHMRFHLLQETLYLTLSIIDRYLQVTNVAKQKLQLVGVTAMLIASKYEEMFGTEVADFVYITDNAYTQEEIRAMEKQILRTLDFSFGKPLCLHFLRRNSKAGQVDAKKHVLAKYLMELTIIEYDFAHLYPSLIAAAALALSMKVIDNSSWTDTLEHYSHYCEEDLLPVMRKLAKLVIKAPSNKLTAIHNKYMSQKFMHVSTLPCLNSNVIHQLAHGLS